MSILYINANKMKIKKKKCSFISYYLQDKSSIVYIYILNDSR